MDNLSDDVLLVRDILNAGVSVSLSDDGLTFLRPKTQTAARFQGPLMRKLSKLILTERTGNGYSKYLKNILIILLKNYLLYKLQQAN